MCVCVHLDWAERSDLCDIIQQQFLYIKVANSLPVLTPSRNHPPARLLGIGPGHSIVRRTRWVRVVFCLVSSVALTWTSRTRAGRPSCWRGCGSRCCRGRCPARRHIRGRPACRRVTGAAAAWASRSWSRAGRAAAGWPASARQTPPGMLPHPGHPAGGARSECSRLPWSPGAPLPGSRAPGSAPAVTNIVCTVRM